MDVGGDGFEALIEETDDAEQAGNVALTILDRIATPIVDVLLDVQRPLNLVKVDPEPKTSA